MVDELCSEEHFQSLLSAISSKTCRVGVVGLGYVGLPLLAAIARAGFSTIGIDIDPEKIAQIDSGRSYIPAVSDNDLAHIISEGRLLATADMSSVSLADVIVVCVPTPLTRNREPDLSFVVDTMTQIARSAKSRQLMVLESTTYPGTTREVVRPIFEAAGFGVEADYFIAFSPEREDPGNIDFRTASIPKIVGGEGPRSLALADLFYSAVVSRTVTVSSSDTAEAVKITENVFRAVNIALVNELKLVFDAMKIDVWEVIDAAATKPFGFMPFYPGPGLGGHCIPIDPFYLTWKAREFGLSTRFVELAGEINVSMPRHIVNRVSEEVDRLCAKGLRGSKVLLLGMAYKKNVSDIRESPALTIMELLDARGAHVEFHDPLVAQIGPTREHPALRGIESIVLDANTIAAFDAVVLVTDHESFDYTMVANSARLIVDTRNAFARRGLANERIVKA